MPRGHLLPALRSLGAGSGEVDEDGVSYVVGDGAGTDTGKGPRLSNLGVRGVAPSFAVVMFVVFVSQGVHKTFGPGIDTACVSVL